MVGQRPRIALLTTFIWEGGYILNELIKKDVNCAILILQRPWWRKNPCSYSFRYRRKLFLDQAAGLYGCRYYDARQLARKSRVPIAVIDDVNTDAINPTVFDWLVVAGSRILKPATIQKFGGRIINFHTGILPFYRGPYSEFWAMFRGEYGRVGTTIHLLDYGIDTGQILDQVFVVPEIDETPAETHVENVKAGASMLASFLARMDGNEIVGLPQDEKYAAYYSTPTAEQVKELSRRLGRGFDISFAE